VICNLNDVEFHKKHKIISCECDELLQIFGLRVGEEIEIIGECLFGGTVIIKYESSFFCIRKSEIEALLEKVD
jgi:Fe2+ transport system protein FeoA